MQITDLAAAPIDCRGLPQNSSESLNDPSGGTLLPWAQSVNKPRNQS
jgi:hypothetical protein